MARLEIAGLGVAFGAQVALSDVSLSLGDGERVAVIGERGAGKSVLARASAGVLLRGATTTGSVMFEGQPLGPATSGVRGKRVGALLQTASSGFDPVRPAIASLLEALGPAGADRDARAEVLLSDVGLPRRRAELYPDQLGAAERQLLAVAVALAPQPELLIADEPAAHLDLIAERRMLDLIDRQARERSMSLLLIASDLRAMAMLCTRIVVLQGGRIVEAGAKSDVLGHPKHAFTRAVLTAGRQRGRALMRAPIGETLLEVRGISKTYRRPDISVFEPRPRVRALDDVSLAMRSGESLALVGPAGAGKSTLLRIVAGLDGVRRGDLEFAGQRYRGSDLAAGSRPDIALVFREPRESFDPQLSLGESVAEPLTLLPDLPPKEIGARLAQVVTAVGLPVDVLRRKPPAVSQGDLQRMALARALVNRPRLLLLDEPIAALDIAARGEILGLLDRLRADLGLTLLMAARDFETIRGLADRVLVMEAGRVVETGTPAQLLDKPQNDVTKRLVAAALPEIGIVPVF